MQTLAPGSCSSVQQCPICWTEAMIVGTFPRTISLRLLQVQTIAHRGHLWAKTLFCLLPLFGFCFFCTLTDVFKVRYTRYIQLFIIIIFAIECWLPPMIWGCISRKLRTCGCIKTCLECNAFVSKTLFFTKIDIPIMSLEYVLDEAWSKLRNLETFSF